VAIAISGCAKVDDKSWSLVQLSTLMQVPMVGWWGAWRWTLSYEI
jgi:hypothetical protein